MAGAGIRGGLTLAATATGSTPWIDELVRFTARLAREFPSVKVIGICFGHQIVARAFAVRLPRATLSTGDPGDTPDGEQGSVNVVQNEAGWELGAYDVELTPIGKATIGKPDGSSVIVRRATIGQSF